MCIAPATALAAASLISSAVGTLVQVQGQRAAATANEQRANYEAAVARNNAMLAEQYAQDAIERGKISEKEHRGKVERLASAQQVALAGRGVVVGQGTAADIVADTAAMGELDALTIRRNAEREAAGFRTQGVNFQTSAELARLRGFTPDATAGTLLAGAGALAERYVSFKQKKVF